jgi:hypothetical protein
MALAPRVVVVHRRTELEELLDRHGSRGQAEFFLSGRGQTLGDIQERHDRTAEAAHLVSVAIPVAWRRGTVERSDLDRFLFADGDLIVVVGQDGLVANTAKYLDGQLVLGVDSDPGHNPGVLVRRRADEVAGLLPAMAEGNALAQARTMVQAELDDGQVLRALNEIFVGHPSHQSARYRLEVGGATELQSSSGLIVGTGTGSTGWCASIAGERPSSPRLPEPTDSDLCWFVREAWPSPGTGTTYTGGTLRAGEDLVVVGQGDYLVAFGDGLESDRLTVTWGQQVVLRRSERVLRLVA